MSTELLVAHMESAWRVGPRARQPLLRYSPTNLQIALFDGVGISKCVTWSRHPPLLPR